MKNKKMELRFFSVPEWKKEENYLREQHKKGWKFVRVDFLACYHFEKCEPEDVIYQLDYNAEGAAGKEDYVQMFHDCGWEYLQDFAGYSYFRKPFSRMEKEEEIFCDDSSRLDMMRRVFKGRIIPLIVCFFSIIIPQILIQSHFEQSETNYVRTGIFVVLLVIYLILFFSFGYQYYKYWKLSK